MNNIESQGDPDMYAGNLSPENSLDYLTNLAQAMRIRLGESLENDQSISPGEAQHWKALFGLCDPRVAGELVLDLMGALDRNTKDQ